MSDNGFIYLLSFGTALLAGIVTVAHVSAYRLKQRLQLRREAGALVPDLGSILEPELDFSNITGTPKNEARQVSVQIRHAETAR